MSSSIKRSLSETTEGSSSPTQQPTKSKTRDTANAKARLPLDAKVIIAEHIVAKGIAVVDVAELELAVSAVLSPSIGHVIWYSV